MLQFILFCIVGVSTTGVDFLVFNLLTRRGIGFKPIPANVISVSTAMTWSFLANWFLVFQPERDLWLHRAGRFLVITAFSAFVLQNLVLHFTLTRWTLPSKAAVALFHQGRLKWRLDDGVIQRNTCKAMAVGTGLVWNFCWYKFFVYTD